jgi:hypothetical protein
VKWLFSKEVEFTFGATVHRSRFRIDGETAWTPRADTKDGVGQESGATFYADAMWHPCPDIDLDGFVGIAAGGKIRVDNANGDKLVDTTYKAAPVIGARVAFRF